MLRESECGAHRDYFVAQCSAQHFFRATLCALSNNPNAVASNWLNYCQSFSLCEVAAFAAAVALWTALIIPISLIVHTTVLFICYAPTRQLGKQTRQGKARRDESSRGESNQVEASRVELS